MSGLFGLPGLDIGQAPAQPGPNDPLTPPQDRLKELAAAFQNQAATMPVHGYGDMIRGLSAILLGNKFGGEYTDQQKAYNKAIGEKATAAVGNPQEMLKVALASQNPAMIQAAMQAGMSPKELPKVIEIDDGYGSKRSVVQNPDGSFREIKIGPAGQPAGTPVPTEQPGQVPQQIPGQSAQAASGVPQQPSMSIGEAVSKGLTGDALLGVIKQNNPAAALEVQAIANGDHVVQRGDQRANALLPLVYAYDPTFNKSDAEARFNFKKSFTDPNHTNMKQALALNNMIEHGGHYMEKILPNMPDNYTSWGDQVSAWTGNLMKDPSYRDAYTLADFLGPESVKVASGAEGGEAERQAAAKRFYPEAGKSNIESSLRTTGGIGESKLRSLLGQWRAVMGDRPIPPNIINPQAQETFERMKALGAKPQADNQSQNVNRAAKSGVEQAAAPAPITSKDQYDKLKSGDEFIAPDGTHRRKP